MNMFLKLLMLFIGGGLISLVIVQVFHLPAIVALILAFLYGWNFDRLFGGEK